VQIAKAVLVLGATIFLTILLMSRFNFSVGALLSAAATASGKGDAFLEPGPYFTNKLDLVSLGFGLALGTAGLPYIIMRSIPFPLRMRAGQLRFLMSRPLTSITR
jgi:cation/acetate symporter